MFTRIRFMKIHENQREIFPNILNITWIILMQFWSMLWLLPLDLDSKKRREVTIKIKVRRIIYDQVPNHQVISRTMREMSSNFWHFKCFCWIFAIFALKDLSFDWIFPICQWTMLAKKQILHGKSKNEKIKNKCCFSNPLVQNAYS